MATKVNTFPESTSRSQTRTLDILRLKSVKRVTVNTGSVTYSVSGETITFNLSGGAVSRRVQTGGSYTPADTKDVTDTRTGKGYIYYKWDGANWDYSHESGQASSSISYSSGGYTGTLTRTGFERTSGITQHPLPQNPTKGQTAVDSSFDWRATYSGPVTKPASDTRTYADYYQYTVTVEYEDNSAPTLTLSTQDNQTLTENSSLRLQGSALDPDPNDNVLIKYKINNSAARNAGSGVSDGSTPISFSKSLTFRDKRLWDGSTDITGANLAENIDHTLTVWAEDNQGGKSAEIIRKFRVIHNRPPVISGKDTNLGIVSVPPVVSYSVTEPEKDTFTVTEYRNGKQTKTFSGKEGQTYEIKIDPATWLRLEPGVPHEIKIRATDSKGMFSERIYTFTRTESRIEFELNMDNPVNRERFTCDARPTRILVTLDAVIPPGASLEKVEVCNNAFDKAPTYEDMTGSVKAGRGYIFTNQTKTAANWGINIRISFDKGTATGRVILNGFGGAFD
ncbi:hypothetical protein NDK47_09345 [Brevibacillus ruminantium]|uniref:Uncharacterized protein n=1 Tax=Brevibacillus ruminantium TaxID=2950604 RepID=A0ABY4WK92_9BACL|nr:hypothetical protein [Brevibacillus ruminantium]USG67458.1 hypothetical protein NDK47_09345 [Brevibacillus ruminantium]